MKEEDYFKETKAQIYQLDPNLEMDHQSLTYEIQKLRSAHALSNISTTTLDQIRSSTILLDETCDGKDILNERMIKAKNILTESFDIISKMDLGEKLSDEALIRMDQKEKAILDRGSMPMGGLKGEQFIRYKQRGSVVATARRPTLLFGLRALPPEIRSSVFRPPSIAGPIKKPEVPISVEESFMEIKITPLNDIESAVLTSVLQECLSRLAIMQHVIPAPINKNWDESLKSIDELYDIPDEPNYIFRSEMGLPPIISNPFEKLQKDRTYAYNVIRNTLREVKCDKNFETLKKEMDNIENVTRGKYNLELNARTWADRIKQLKKSIETNNKDNEKEKRKTQEFARRMSSQVNDTIFLNGLKLGYIERWEKVRYEQQNIRLEEEERKLLDELNEISKLQNANQIICGEICSYLQTNTDDIESEIIEWTKRYDEEFERRQIMIDDLKIKTEEQNLALEDLRLMVEREQEMVDHMRAERENIRKEEEYWSTVRRAATIIQALWRGYAVRHQIGEYQDLWAKLQKRKKKGKKGKRKGKKVN